MWTAFTLADFAAAFNGDVALMLSAPVVVWGSLRVGKWGILSVIKRLFGRM